MHAFMHTSKNPKCMHWWAALTQELSVFLYFFKLIRGVCSLRSDIISEPVLPQSMSVVHVLKYNWPEDAPLCCMAGYRTGPA